MSHSFRPTGLQPSVPVGQTPLPARMVAPICTTGSPAVYPVMPNSYGLLPQQPQQFMTQTVYPQALPHVPNRTPFVAAIPSNVPRIYVPVAPVPAGLSPSIPDPTKLFEEQRRLEKERNFQMQQERLKQFTIAGKKPNLNPDNLIDSMFGKLQPKKTAQTVSSFPSIPSNVNEHKESNQVEKPLPLNIEATVLRNEPCVPKLDSSSVAKSISPPLKKDVKELESMMLECSNLKAPSKAVAFQKPSVNDILLPTHPSSHNTVFTASEKARDWRNVQGLDEVFTAPKPRFPSWCAQGNVPEQYKKIQSVVTNNETHPPDTNLLFPILVSSGLSRESLGQVWELVNVSASGKLTTEEMYAILALIALVQAGHPVKSIDILHQLPSAPIPQLGFFTNASAPLDQNNPSAVPNEESCQPATTSQIQQPQQQVHQVIRPTAISLMNNIQSSKEAQGIENITQNVAGWTPFAGSQGNTSDDDFDDFKSATPTAINFSLNTPSTAAPAPEDDFNDFKQAPCIAPPEASSVPTKLPIASNMMKNTSETATQDLMSPEDKYSVFRALQETEDTSHWGDFSRSEPNNSSSALPVQKDNFSNSQFPSVLVADNTNNTNLYQADLMKDTKITQDDDEFGDFVHASVTPVPTTTVTNFADFSNFNQAESEETSVPQVDEEFGEFASSVPVSLKPDLGHDFLFRHLKDNISLAESQSVSSLELGTFDGGGGHSGESKSSLSRQGSIPSLDLKSVGLDGADSEDCFGEIQLSPFVPQSSNSSSPISNSKGLDEHETSSAPIGLFQTSTVPFADKYSVIRQEKPKEEDLHISCWMRCLKSAVSILKNTKKIFNQMSCSSICNEVLNSEEGGNYVKNVIEVYKVIRRISLISKSHGKQTDSIIDILNEADQVWNTLCGFFAGSTLMPPEASLNFSRSILRPEPENNAKACGLCLLNIELRSKSFKQEECPKLSYGGRNYHSTCANFWVNCVDPLLPALTLPQLL